MTDRTLAGAAAQEAWEEGGVKGDIKEDAIGAYTYEKAVRGTEMSQPITVEVYPLRVEQTEQKYPERKQRERRWMTPEAAANSVAEPALKRLIANFPA